MREWFEREVAAGLPAFAGSQISGTLALRQELINEVLAQWLENSQRPPAAGTAQVTQLVTAIKRAAVRAEAGVVLVDFEISL